MIVVNCEALTWSPSVASVFLYFMPVVSSLALISSPVSCPVFGHLPGSTPFPVTSLLPDGDVLPVSNLLPVSDFLPVYDNISLIIFCLP
jgi:hypothetical protein